MAKAAAGPTRRGRIGRGAIIWRCRESRRVACAAVGRDRVKNWGVLFGAFHAIFVGFSVQVGRHPGFTGASRSFQRHLMLAKLYLWHQTLFRQELNSNGSNNKQKTVLQYPLELRSLPLVLLVLHCLQPKHLPQSRDKDEIPDIEEWCHTSNDRDLSDETEMVSNYPNLSGHGVLLMRGAASMLAQVSRSGDPIKRRLQKESALGLILSA